jgi:hypothetical protein
MKDKLTGLDIGGMTPDKPYSSELLARVRNMLL